MCDLHNSSGGPLLEEFYQERHPDILSGGSVSYVHANFFSKGPDGKYFRFFELYCLSSNYPTLPMRLKEATVVVPLPRSV